MLNRSYATLKPNAPHTRISSLVHDLEEHGCALPLQRDTRLEFDVADCNLWWIAQGGLNDIFSHYSDVASWPGTFYDASSKQRTSFVNA